MRATSAREGTGARRALRAEAELGLPGAFAWMGSRSAAIAILGFALNLTGALGGAFYLEPALKAENAASLEIALQSARARMILAANAHDNIAENLGSALFSVPVGADAPQTVRAAVGDLMKRALDRRHEATRAYIAELAVAGAVDFQTTLKQHEALVEAERAHFDITTYRAVNAFEGDLAARMVKAEGEAAMKAITLQAQRTKARQVANQRKLILTSVALFGSTLMFAATLAFARTSALAPTPGGGGLALALDRIRERRMRG